MLGSGQTGAQQVGSVEYSSQQVVQHYKKYRMGGNRSVTWPVWRAWAGSTIVNTDAWNRHNRWCLALKIFLIVTRMRKFCENSRQMPARKRDSWRGDVWPTCSVWKVHVISWMVIIFRHYANTPISHTLKNLTTAISSGKWFSVFGHKPQYIIKI